jgi:hypothetical protein
MYKKSSLYTIPFTALPSFLTTNILHYSRASTMLNCWRITYPDGIGYTNDKLFLEVIETNLEDGNISPSKCIIEEVPMKIQYMRENGGLHLHQKQGRDSWVTKGGEWIKL